MYQMVTLFALSFAPYVEFSETQFRLPHVIMLCASASSAKGIQYTVEESGFEQLRMDDVSDSMYHGQLRDIHSLDKLP